MAKAFRVRMDLTKLRNGFDIRHKATATAVEKAIQEGGQTVHGSVVESLQAGGSGNLYDRVDLGGYKGVFLVSGGKRIPVAFMSDDGNAPPNGLHRASAAGQAPATDTGELVSGMQVSYITQSNIKIANIRSLAPYSGLLEYGTAKIKPRPFMGPAFIANVDGIVNDIKKAIHSGFRKGDDGSS